VRLAVPATDPMLGYVARTGVIVSVEDASIDPRFNVDLVNILLSVVAAQVQQDIISQGTFPMAIIQLMTILLSNTTRNKYAHTDNFTKHLSVCVYLSWVVFLRRMVIS